MIFKKYSHDLISAVVLMSFVFAAACGNGERSDEGMVVTAQDDLEINENDFQSIFDGESLSGWDGDDRFWSVEDGAIVGETSEDNPTESNTFLVWEEGEPSDFELRFQYRFLIVSGHEYGNSGIQIRSEQFTDENHPVNRWRVRGYQPDFAISDWIPGILYEEAGREILARRGQSVLIDSDGESHVEEFADEGELGEYIEMHSNWNDYQVYANGDTIRTYINGQRMHELVDQSPEARSEGILAFQVHSGPPMRVEIRDVELKILD